MAAALVDADLFIIDDGAGGTNKKATLSLVKTYVGAGTGLPLAGGTMTGDITMTNGENILPAAVGGSNLGSATAEWGDIFLADDKFIKFGSDQDVTIEYDTAAQNALLISGAGAHY